MSHETETSVNSKFDFGAKIQTFLTFIILARSTRNGMMKVS